MKVAAYRDRAPEKHASGVTAMGRWRNIERCIIRVDTPPMGAPGRPYPAVSHAVVSLLSRFLMIPFVVRRKALFGAAVALSFALPSQVMGQEVPEKDLGKPAGVMKEGFERAFSGIALADGRVLFVDASGSGTTAFARADFKTGKVERIMVAGPGDDQFRSTGAPMHWTGDSIAFIDLGKARLTILAPDGSYARAIKLGEPPVERVAAAGGGGRGGRGGGDATAGAGPDLAARGPRIPSARYAAAPGTLFGVGFAPRPVGLNPVVAPPRQPFPIVRFSLASLTYDTVVQLMPAQAPRPPQRNQETSTMLIAIPTTPFQAVDSWVAFRDGFVAVVRGATYRVDLIAPDGTRAGSEPIPYPKLDVTDNDRKEFVSTYKKTTEENLSRGGSGSQIRTFSFSEPAIWPTTHPPFRGDVPAVLGSDDRIWLAVRCTKDEKAVCYDVIDRAGLRVARYRLPAKSRVLAAGADAVFTVNESKGNDYTMERFALR